MQSSNRRSLIISILVLVAVGTIVLTRGAWKQWLEPEVSKRYKIGILIHNPPVHNANIEGLKAGLLKLGYEEGKNVEYILKNANADLSLVDKLADELVLLQPDIIVTPSTPGAFSLKQKTASIPIVFLDVGTIAGLVQNTKAPEANFTGVIGGTSEFAGKRLEILKEIDATIKKVIVAPDTKFPSYSLFMSSLKDAADKLGIEVVEMPTENAKDFVTKLPAIINKKNGDAFIYFPGPNNFPISKDDQNAIIGQLIKEKISSINHVMELGANNGVFISYGIYRFEIGMQAAVLVNDILKGKPILSLPVEFAKDLLLEINLDTAKSIGLNISQSTISRANKIYNQ